MNDQPNTDDTPDANNAARRAALERLAARLFDRDRLARVDEDGWGLEPDASAQSQPDIGAAPAVDEEERPPSPTHDDAFGGGGGVDTVSA